jgi:hypothetical protein
MNDKFQYGDAPIEPDYIEKMKALARAMDEIFNGELRGHDRTTGFIMLVFPFNSHEGRCNYISNGAAREDVIVMLKEQIKRFEGQPEMSGNA